MSASQDLSRTSIVLVHGAWHGAWCWKRVLPLLRGAGVDAHAVTLTGVGERAHLLSPSVGIATHVQDIIGLTYNPLTKVYRLGNDTSVNYLIHLRRSV